MQGISSTKSEGILDTKTKAKSGILTIAVAVVNTIGAMFALPQLIIPEAADTQTTTTTIIVWALNVIILYAPTIVTFFSSLIYTKAKVQQNIAGIEAGTTVKNGQVVPVITNGGESGIKKIICPKCGKLVDDRTWCSECDAVLHPTAETSTYAVPPELTSIGADKPTPFGHWIEFDAALDWPLTAYDPQIRMSFAMDILKQYKILLDDAWKAELAALKAKASDIADLIPSATDFNTYNDAQAFKKKVMDAIPGCEWLNINQDSMLRGYEQFFRGINWISKLFDKKIDWKLVRSINEIAQLNYGAVLS